MQCKREALAAGNLKSGDSEKLRNTLDVFEYWLLRFRAFGHVRLQPPAAGRKQSVNGVAD